MVGIKIKKIGEVVIIAIPCIPFETMNLFYRDDKEAYLKTLQAERESLPV